MIIRKVKVTEYEYQAPINYVAGATEPDIQFQLTDYEIPSGATGRVYVGRSDGTFEYTVATISGNNVTVAPTSSMFSVKGPGAIQVTLYVGNEVVKNFAVPVYVHADLADDSAEAGSDVTGVFRAAEEEALADFQEQAEQIVDEVIEEIPADYTALTEEVSELNERIDNIEPGLSDDAKAALLACFRHVSFLDDDANYYGALESALYPSEYPMITASLNLGTHVVYEGDSVDTLKPYLTVMYFEDEDDTGTIIGASSYSLSGNLSFGVSTVLVNYNNCTTTFTVNVATHIIYSLPNPVTMNQVQSEIIDTGLALLETDRDFTLIGKCETNYAPSDGKSMALYGIGKSNFRTFLPSQNDSMHYTLNSVGTSTNKWYPIPSPWTTTTFENTIIVAVSHVAGSNELIARYWVDDVEADTNYIIMPYTYLETSKPLVIGGRWNNAATAMIEPFAGTIDVFKVYDYAMTQSDMDSVYSELR